MNRPVYLEIKSSVFKDIYEIDEGSIYNFQTYLAGIWSRSESTITIHSPIDNAVIAKVPRLTWKDVDPILTTIYKKGRWKVRGIPGDKRLDMLHKIADLMEKYRDDLAHVLMINAGKTSKQAYGEVEASIERLRKSELDVRKIMGEYVPGDWSDHTLESEGIVRREPYGVVLAIIPFNYPLFDTVNKFTYSVVAGNAVIVKPPSYDPLPVLLFARIVEEAGFPKNGFAVMTIPGRESGKLVSDRRIQVISFTGSTETGIAVIREAGIKQFILELGGGDPAIVLKDADLNLAAEKIAIGMTSYSGQRCDAIKLVLCERPVYDELKEKLVSNLSKIKVGDPRENSVDMGPLIDPSTVDEMLNAVSEVVEKGGRVIYGGNRLGPTYVEPTLVEVEDKKVLLSLKLYRDEMFAPVALITNVKSVDEAIELANARRYGLDAAIFGRDIDKIRKLIRYLEVGAVYINEYPRHGIGYYPFGGRKDSGISREGIGYSIEHVTALKTIVYNYRGRGIWEYI